MLHTVRSSDTDYEWRLIRCTERYQWIQNIILHSKPHTGKLPELIWSVILGSFPTLTSIFIKSNYQEKFSQRMTCFSYRCSSAKHQGHKFWFMHLRGFYEKKVFVLPLLSSTQYTSHIPHMSYFPSHRDECPWITLW